MQIVFQDPYSSLSPRLSIAQIVGEGLRVHHLAQGEEERRRIDEAAKHIPLDQIAISPQCGFASDVIGNLITPEVQRRKLEVVVETARRVWG